METTTGIILIVALAIVILLVGYFINRKGIKNIKDQIEENKGIKTQKRILRAYSPNSKQLTDKVFYHGVIVGNKFECINDVGRKRMYSIELNFTPIFERES
jgi:uncharacterized protein YneF (UPF0154 family)